MVLVKCLEAKINLLFCHSKHLDSIGHSLRCLDLEIWQFLYGRQQQMTKPIIFPSCIYVCRVIILFRNPEPSKRGLIPICADDVQANGAPAIPITIRAAPENASSEPETSALVLPRNGSQTVKIAMEPIQPRTQGDGGDTLAGPPLPPPPTYEQSMSHPMVIIKEQESPEVLEALYVFISGFSDAACTHGSCEMNKEMI